MRSLVSMLLIAVLGGCQAHVKLTAPRVDAPLEQRTKAYGELRPLSRHDQIVLTGTHGTLTSATQVTDYLQLANGTRVYYPEDLLAVLPSDSPSARAALDSQRARRTTNAIWGAAGAVAAAGLGVALWGFASGPSDTSDPDFGGGVRNAVKFGFVGIGLAVVATTAGILFGMPYSREANDAASTSFDTYDAGLRTGLGMPTD